MNKPYLILENGKLSGRKATRLGAMKVVEARRNMGINACVAYEMPNGSGFQPVEYSSVWKYLNQGGK